MNVNTLQDMIDALEREGFEAWAVADTPFGTQRNDEGFYVSSWLENAWAAWKARGRLQSKCRGVTRDGCNYLAACGGLCNKCGRRH